MVLNALSQELDNELFKSVNLLEGLMAQEVKDKKDFFSKLYDKLYEFRYNLEHDNEGYGRAQARKSRMAEEERLTSDPEINRLIAQWKAMDESGELDKVAQKLDDAHAQHLEERKNPFHGLSAEELTWSYKGSSSQEAGDEGNT